MKVKELIELLKDKEDYDIEIDYVYDDFEIEIDEENETVYILLNEDSDSEDCNFDCDNCLSSNTCSDNPDNAWRYSNYESKDIEDWDVDDHLATWYDHMMEK